MNVDKLYKINVNPLVFAGNGNCLHKLDSIIKEQRVFLFWHPSWRISIKSLPKLLKTNLKFKRHNSVFVICCNSKLELKLCKLFGLKAHLLNQNLHKCEFEFTPKTVDKVYDAHYIAQARPFKRMHLASEIKSLFILTYGCKNYVNEEGNDLARFEPKVKHADWNKSFIHDRQEISKLLCSSYCGLALSKREGAMWASVQCFLCGIPLVSTRSQGGRDFFYDKDYVTVVKSNTESVKNAVEYYKKNTIDPIFIRNKTLEKIKTHRLEYLEVLKFYLGESLFDNKELFYQKLWGSSNGIKKFLYK